MAQQGKPRGVRSRRLWNSQRAPGTSLWKLGTSTETPTTSATTTAMVPATATTSEAEQRSLTEMSQAIPIIPMPVTTYRDLPVAEGSYTLTQAIDRYVNFILPSAGAVQRLTSMETTTACTAMLQLIANDDLIRAGTWTYSLCSFPGALERGTVTHRDMIHARSQLVDGIRAIISQGPSDRLIYAMVFLMAVDSMLNYSDHARLHLKGMNTILELKDGIEDLDRLPFGAGNLGDSVCGTFALTYSSMKVHEEPSETTPYLHEMQGSEEVTIQLESLPVGFRRLGQSGKLSAATINCLFDLQQIHLPAGVPAPSLFNRGTHLDLPLPWSSSFPQPRTRLERLIYITARTVAYDLCPTPNPIRMVFRDPRRYDEDLLDERIWTAENLPCLAWMITVINSTLPWCVESKCRELLSRLTQRYPPARSWTLLSKVLEEFFVYSHLKVRWAQLWQEFYATQITT